MQGVAGLTKRDIQLVVDGGYQTVEAVAYTPRRMLEQIKGISEQKAAKRASEAGIRKSSGTLFLSQNCVNLSRPALYVERVVSSREAIMTSKSLLASSSEMVLSKCSRFLTA